MENENYYPAASTLFRAARKMKRESAVCASKVVEVGGRAKKQGSMTVASASVDAGIVDMAGGWSTEGAKEA